MAGMEGGVGGPKLNWRTYWLVMLGLLVGGVALICVSVRLGYAASFYPACLKPAGDWVHGVTTQECRQLKGRWVTNKVLKKAWRVM